MNGVYESEKGQLRSSDSGAMGSDGQEHLLESERGSKCCPPSEQCFRRYLTCCRACCGEIWFGAGREICKLLCCPPLPSRIASKLAFAPPPASYDIRLDPGTQRCQLWLRTPGTVAWDSGNWRLFEPARMHEHFGGAPTAAPFTLDVDWMRTQSRQFIPGLWMRPAQYNPRSTFTLLFSHGNGTDLGEMLEFFVVLVRDMQVAVYAYDYSGYGAGTGETPHEAQVLQDATTAWNKLTAPPPEGHGVSPDRIILYGQSIGSGPSTYLASREWASRAAALILHSPILSGIRVLLPIERTLMVDPFPNIDWIQNVPIPTAVIHGRIDEIVPFAHGQQLHRASRHPLPPLWLNGAGHNDIAAFPQYYQYLAATLERVRSSDQSTPTIPPRPGATGVAPMRM